MKKTLFSGIKPTGRLHIGNYFGAMKQFVDLENSGEYNCYFSVVDYHALNFIQNKKEMSELTLSVALDYLAIGIDPNKSVIFKQSEVSAHTETAWIFDTIVTMPYLQRAHAYKDAQAKNKEINVGTFNYPVLMAADILLYDTDVVPVGQDQKQHVEYARDIAQRFNHIFGDRADLPASILKTPEPLILEAVATVPGIDGQKMSKSYNNTIPLFASRDEISKAVMSIVTDSGGAENGGIPKNVYAIHRLFRTEAELKPLYDENEGKYKVLKENLIEDIDTMIKPLRERREMIAADRESVLKVLEEGGKKAREVANKKLLEIKRAIGVSS